MNLYKYKAKDNKGTIIKGTIEKETDAEFYRYLEEQKLHGFSVEVKNLEGRQEKEEYFKMSLKDLSVFCREFAVLLASGMNLMMILQLLYDRAEKNRYKSCYMRMIEGIEKGDSLYDSMKKQGKIFPPLLKSMILAGESSGTIDLVMEKMALYYEKEANMKEKVQNALIYPIILIIVTVAVVLVLFTFVMPQFFTMLEGQELPLITKVFMAISKVLTNYWYILLLVLLAIIFFIKMIAKNDRVAYALDRFLLKMPVIGKLMEKIIMAHFANAMNILYASGITIIRSLEIGGETITNIYVSRKLEVVRETVEKGVDLSAAMESEKIFDKMFWAMVHVGEESGNLETMFLKLAEYLETESEHAIQKMMSIIEPAILIIVAGIVGAVVVSVLLPIYSMYQMY
ncbi:MAG: type II secretion system F family protein [Lachnospiraceae bacterium]